MERFECILKMTLVICTCVVAVAFVVRTSVVVRVEDCVIHVHMNPKAAVVEEQQ